MTKSVSSQSSLSSLQNSDSSYETASQRSLQSIQTSHGVPSSSPRSGDGRFEALTQRSSPSSVSYRSAQGATSLADGGGSRASSFSPTEHGQSPSYDTASRLTKFTLADDGARSSTTRGSQSHDTHATGSVMLDNRSRSYEQSTNNSHSSELSRQLYESLNSGTHGTRQTWQDSATLLSSRPEQGAGVSSRSVETEAAMRSAMELNASLTAPTVSNPADYLQPLRHSSESSRGNEPNSPASSWSSSEQRLMDQVAQSLADFRNVEAPNTRDWSWAGLTAPPATPPTSVSSNDSGNAGSRASSLASGRSNAQEKDFSWASVTSENTVRSGQSSYASAQAHLLLSSPESGTSVSSHQSISASDGGARSEVPSSQSSRSNQLSMFESNTVLERRLRDQLSVDRGNWPEPWDANSGVMLEFAGNIEDKHRGQKPYEPSDHGSFVSGASTIESDLRREGVSAWKGNVSHEDYDPHGSLWLRETGGIEDGIRGGARHGGLLDGTSVEPDESYRPWREGYDVASHKSSTSTESDSGSPHLQRSLSRDHPSEASSGEPSSSGRIPGASRFAFFEERSYSWSGSSNRSVPSSDRSVSSETSAESVRPGDPAQPSNPRRSDNSSEFSSSSSEVIRRLRTDVLADDVYPFQGGGADPNDYLGPQGHLKFRDMGQIEDRRRDGETRSYRSSSSSQGSSVPEIARSYDDRFPWAQDGVSVASRQLSEAADRLRETLSHASSSPGGSSRATEDSLAVESYIPPSEPQRSRAKPAKAITSSKGLFKYALSNLRKKK